MLGFVLAAKPQHFGGRKRFQFGEASLDLREFSYGWPTEMVVKAAQAGLPIAQVEVPSRARRGGRSKVSGRLGPSLRAGARMLAVVARHA